MPSSRWPRQHALKGVFCRFLSPILSFGHFFFVGLLHIYYSFWFCVSVSCVCVCVCMCLCTCTSAIFSLFFVLCFFVFCLLFGVLCLRKVGQVRKWKDLWGAKRGASVIRIYCTHVRNCQIAKSTNSFHNTWNKIFTLLNAKQQKNMPKGGRWRFEESIGLILLGKKVSTD